MFVPCTALLYDSTAATRTLKLSTTPLSVSCGIHLILASHFSNRTPSYSEDLNPPDYFLKGYLKDRTWEKNPQTRKDIIRREIRRIPQEMLNRFMNNFNVQVTAVLSYSSAVHGTNIVLITEKL